MSVHFMNDSKHSRQDDDLLSYEKSISEDEEADLVDFPSVVRIAEPSDPFSSNNYGFRNNSYGSLNPNSAVDANKLRIAQALASTGLNSSGIVIVEAWVMNEKKTSLHRPDGAIWSDPSYKPPSCLDEETCHEALQKLQDPSHRLYTAPYPMQPGVGFAGLLWTEKTVTSTTTSSDSTAAMAENKHEEKLIWRDLEFMSIDPHHIPDNRLKIFLEAGIGRVAGIPFDFPDGAEVIKEE